MSNIHIPDSYRYSKSEMRSYLDCKRKYPLDSDKEVLAHRSNFSLINEWCVHNLLYKLGIARARTKDIDLNYPQPWYIRALYFCGGIIARIFIRDKK